jgi:hypothetical protein
VAREAQALPTEHQTLICFFLRDLDDARNPSYSLVAANMGHGGPAVTAQFGRTSMVVGSLLSGASAPRTCAERLLDRSIAPNGGRKLKFGGYQGIGGFLTCVQKFAQWAALYIGVFR